MADGLYRPNLPLDMVDSHFRYGLTLARWAELMWRVILFDARVSHRSCAGVAIASQLYL